MAHQSTNCDCGRKIHLPKNAPLGYKWKCNNCGKTWTVSNQGKRTYSARSKKPPSGKGCLLMGLMLFFSMGITLYLVF